MAFTDNKPHRRFNPLLGEWVKVSPHRTQRPWQGQTEDSLSDGRPAYDPQCYLCPGNTRNGGALNPRYDSTFSFINDFSALPQDGGTQTTDEPFFRAEEERGVCKVLCFSPDHSLTMARMTVPEIRTVVDLWEQEYRNIGALDYISYVQIFENHGSAMGCSNPHPHGQIWADAFIPDIPRKESGMMKEYFEKNQSPLLHDYTTAELKSRERIVAENESFAVLVPYWAVWPYETMILPKEQKRSLSDLSDKEKTDLADILSRTLVRYDNIFNIDFPYTMGIHQAPCENGRSYPEWTLHFHFSPPLLRSATVKKFMVGYELMAMPQRDITPETAAEILRSCSDIHYSRRSDS